MVKLNFPEIACRRQIYSVLRLLAGLFFAAFIVSKLTVPNAISSAATPANTNTHQQIATRYA